MKHYLVVSPTIRDLYQRHIHKLKELIRNDRNVTFYNHRLDLVGEDFITYYRCANSIEDCTQFLAMKLDMIMFDVDIKEEVQKWFTEKRRYKR